MILVKIDLCLGAEFNPLGEGLIMPTAVHYCGFCYYQWGC